MGCLAEVHVLEKLERATVLFAVWVSSTPSVETTNDEAGKGAKLESL